LSYRLIEEPVRRRGSAQTRLWPTFALGACLSSTVAATALLVYVLPHASPAGPSAANIGDILVTSPDPAAAMRQIVRASLEVRKLPSNLSPSLQQASSDAPRIYSDGCHADKPDLAPDPGCRFGATTSSKTVVLFGDSHAAQWFPAFESIARAHDWKLVPMTKSSCSAADIRIWNPALRRNYWECDAWRTAAISAIQSLRPSLIVVSSSSEYSSIQVGHGPATDWTAGWGHTISSLRRTKSQLVVIADTPTLKSPVPVCLSQNPTEIDRCQSPVSSTLSRSQRPVIQGLAHENGIRLIDPVPWLCQRACPPVLGNALAYRDSSHLTTVLSAALAPMISEDLPRI
jgi:hypothetical protein